MNYHIVFEWIGIAATVGFIMLLILIGVCMLYAKAMSDQS